MAKDHSDLEDELVEAIQTCCRTEEDKAEALRYFRGVTVNKMIEEAV